MYVSNCASIFENFGIDYVPKILPCGEEINQDEDNGECCRTVCPNKTNRQIDKCFSMYKVD
jgi:hypothetical protein